MTTTLSSRIEAVTVYRQGALVRRAARLEPEGGKLPEQVVLGGLPLCLDERSLRVKVKREQGPAPVATDLKVGLEVGEPDLELPPADDEALRLARAKERGCLDLLTLLRDELERILELEVAPRPEPEEGKEPRPSPVEGRLSLLVFREREGLRLHGEIAEATEALRLAQLARQEIEAQRATESNARQRRAEELRKTVEIGLRLAEGSGAGAVELTLEYLVPGAHWSPAYTLELDEGLGAGKLSVRAAVRQRTGEDWKGVALTLSTAEALRWSELPELKALRIGRRQPSPPKVGWRPPPQGAATLYADHDAAFPPDGSPPQQGSDSRDKGYGGPVGGMVAQSVLMDEFGSGAHDYPDAEPPEPMVESFADDDDEGDWEAAAEVELAEPEMMMREEAKADFSMPPPAPSAPAPVSASVAAPMMKAKKSMASNRGGRAARKRRAPARPGAIGGASEPDERELTASADLLQYGALRMRAPADPRRGKLTPVSSVEVTLQLVQAMELSITIDPAPILQRAMNDARSITGQALPNGHVLPRSEGGYDYAYRATLPVDVPSDGATHTLALLEARGEAKASYICVPRESTEVFRQVAFHNPLDAPLLDGPVDVQVGEDYLLTSRARNTPAKGELKLGLGVEQAIKVARNVRFEEESKGLVLTKLGLEHELEIELTSHLPAPVEVEVRERLPVSVENDDDVEVEELEVKPPWEDLEQEPPVQGGKRWRLKLPPTEKTVLKATYLIRIPKGHELVGGNRREVS